MSEEAFGIEEMSKWKHKRVKVKSWENQERTLALLMAGGGEAWEKKQKNTADLKPLI